MLTVVKRTEQEISDDLGAESEGCAVVSALLRKRWSLYCDSCRGCGRSDRRHYGRGFCGPCYKHQHHAGTLPAPISARWSMWADQCVECGRSDRPHESRGICHVCRQARYRNSAQGQDAIRRYVASLHGQAVRRACEERYRASPQAQRVARHGTRRRRELSYGVAMDVPLEYETLVYEVFGRRCSACGESAHLTLDHHRPLRAGHALLHNAVPLCASCNAQKGPRQPEQFYDPWRLVEILIGLHEVRARFERRFGSLATERVTV